MSKISDVVMFTASVEELAAAATSTAEERVVVGKAKASQCLIN